MLSIQNLYYRHVPNTCLTLLITSMFMLTGCGRLIENVSNLGETRSYEHAQALEDSLVIQPPRVQLDLYHSVQSTTRQWQRPDVAVAVAASGGGYRAANLTAGVLMGLEKITDDELKGNLLQEVDYFSTVSGGGFATGLYLTHLKKTYIKHR